MSHGNLYGPADYHKCQRIQIVAKYSDKNIELKTDKVPSNLTVPENSVPIYTEGDFTLFDANAIGYHLGNAQMRGNDNALVSQWCNYADLVLLPAIGTMVLPCMGLMQFNKSENDKASKLIEGEFKFINKHLSTRTFLSSERISQSDITVFSVIKSLFELIYDEAARRPLVHLTRWFQTIANQDNVLAVMGAITLCDVPAKFDAKKYAELHPSAKKTEKKPKEEKKEKKKDVEEDDEEDLPKQPAPKDPFSLLPKGTFDMDEWKRTYSNNDIATIAMPYFWNKLDRENYSIWECEYLFPEELSILFMTCNLVGGMFQRLDSLRKHAFASMVVIGKDNANTIKGVWVWRGQDLAFTLSQDCQVDYESYKWTKLDSNSEETKKKVSDYFTQTGDFGKPFYQGKIFK